MSLHKVYKLPCMGQREKKKRKWRTSLRIANQNSNVNQGFPQLDGKFKPTIIDWSLHDKMDFVLTSWRWGWHPSSHPRMSECMQITEVWSNYLSQCNRIRRMRQKGELALIFLEHMDSQKSDSTSDYFFESCTDSSFEWESFGKIRAQPFSLHTERLLQHCVIILQWRFKNKNPCFTSDPLYPSAHPRPVDI